MESEGKVVGLREALNDWFLRDYMQTTPADRYIAPTKPLRWVPLGTGTYGDKGGNLAYSLLDRQGCVALWALTQVPCMVRYPQTSLDVEGCMRWGESGLILQILVDNYYPTMCDEVLTDTGLPYVLAFMTVGHTMPVGEVQSGADEHVVSMGIIDPYDIPTAWAFFIDNYQPEETLWRQEGPVDYWWPDPMKGRRLQ